MIGEASPTVYVTEHAIDRYLERIDGSLTRDEARERIEASAPAITIAARFGCHAVIQAGGVRLVLIDERVVTVTSRFGRPRAGGPRECEA